MAHERKEDKKMPPQNKSRNTEITIFVKNSRWLRARTVAKPDRLILREFQEKELIGTQAKEFEVMNLIQSVAQQAVAAVSLLAAENFSHQALREHVEDGVAQ